MKRYNMTAYGIKDINGAYVAYKDVEALQQKLKNAEGLLRVADNLIKQIGAVPPRLNITRNALLDNISDFLTMPGVADKEEADIAGMEQVNSIAKLRCENQDLRESIAVLKAKEIHLNSIVAEKQAEIYMLKETIKLAASMYKLAEGFYAKPETDFADKPPMPNNTLCQPAESEGEPPPEDWTPNPAKVDETKVCKKTEALRMFLRAIRHNDTFLLGIAENMARSVLHPEETKEESEEEPPIAVQLLQPFNLSIPLKVKRNLLAEVAQQIEKSDDWTAWQFEDGSRIVEQPIGTFKAV